MGEAVGGLLAVFGRERGSETPVGEVFVLSEGFAILCEDEGVGGEAS